MERDHQKTLVGAPVDLPRLLTDPGFEERLRVEAGQGAYELGRRLARQRNAQRARLTWETLMGPLLNDHEITDHLGDVKTPEQWAKTFGLRLQQHWPLANASYTGDPVHIETFVKGLRNIVQNGFALERWDRDEATGPELKRREAEAEIAEREGRRRRGEDQEDSG